ANGNPPTYTNLQGGPGNGMSVKTPFTRVGANSTIETTASDFTLPIPVTTRLYLDFWLRFENLGSSREYPGWKLLAAYRGLSRTLLQMGAVAGTFTSDEMDGGKAFTPPPACVPDATYNCYDAADCVYTEHCWSPYLPSAMLPAQLEGTWNHIQ